MGFEPNSLAEEHKNQMNQDVLTLWFTLLYKCCDPIQNKVLT